MKVLRRKCRSAFWHAGDRISRLQSGVREWKRNRVAEKWLRKIESRPPEVLIGANFVDVGGTRTHMHSICRYTSHHAQLAPGESVMAVLSPNEFMGRFWSRFSDLKCRGIKVAHSHVFPRYIDWCMNSRKKHGTRWVHTHHNWYYPEFGRNGIEPWQQEFNEGFRMAATEADVCLCVSRGQQRFFREQFGIRCFYMPNGVDVKACRRGSAENWVKTTGIRQGFVLFVGRNDPVKNPEFFVALAGAMPDRQFVIAGQGISEEVIETEWNLRIPRNLHVLGTLDHAEVQDAIAACSVLVLCSRREGLPTLVLEGMVAGKPVVVPDEEGCMEAIGDGRYGFIYQSGNLAECAARVLDAEADRTVRFLSQQHAVNMYAWPQILDRLDRIYDGESPRNIAGCL